MGWGILKAASLWWDQRPSGWKRPELPVSGLSEDSSRRLPLQEGARASPTPESVGTLSGHFPATRTMKNKCLWFQPPSVCTLLQKPVGRVENVLQITVRTSYVRSVDASSALQFLSPVPNTCHPFPSHTGTPESRGPDSAGSRHLSSWSEALVYRLRMLKTWALLRRDQNRTPLGDRAGSSGDRRCCEGGQKSERKYLRAPA